MPLRAPGGAVERRPDCIARSCTAGARATLGPAPRPTRGCTHGKSAFDSAQTRRSGQPSRFIWIGVTTEDVYSGRRAANGSPFIARRTGTSHASMATLRSSPAIASVNGVGRPYLHEEIHRPQPNAERDEHAKRHTNFHDHQQRASRYGRTDRSRNATASSAHTCIPLAPPKQWCCSSAGPVAG